MKKKRVPASDLRRTLTAGMPERQYLQSSGRFAEAVVEIVVDATDVRATHPRERDVPSPRADERLKCDQRGGAFELDANRTRRPWSVELPPRLGCPHVRRRERAYLDVKRVAHSRSRSSPTSCVRGMVSPRSHWAMESRSMRSVSGSASNVSSPSRTSTVTDAPSGSSLSSSTRPPYDSSGCDYHALILAAVGFGFDCGRQEWLAAPFARHNPTDPIDFSRRRRGCRDWLTEPVKNFEKC